jgi:hypothetical protein
MIKNLKKIITLNLLNYFYYPHPKNLKTKTKQTKLNDLKLKIKKGINKL